MRLLAILLLGLLPGLAPLVASAAAEAPARVTVADPFLELHTGPGRGFPITYVVERGADVEVLKRRTDWFKVRAEGGLEGWVSRAQMAQTLTELGEPLPINDPQREDFGLHRRELGVLTGDFEGANVITAYGAYTLNPLLNVEVRLSQLLGNSSNGWIVAAGVSHVFRPDWRVAPFVSLGTGLIRLEPKGTLVQTLDREDQLAYVGGGFKAYLSRRFILRAEYNKYLVFTDRDENEDANEWKVGFAFFF